LCSLLLAHRRQREADPPPGLAAFNGLTVSPGPEALSAGTLEIALVWTGREQAVVRLFLAPISRAAARDNPSFSFATAAAWSRGECHRAGAASTL